MIPSSTQFYGSTTKNLFYVPFARVFPDPVWPLLQMKVFNFLLLFIFSTVSHLFNFFVGEFQQLQNKEDDSERFQLYLNKTFNKTASLIAYRFVHFFLSSPIFHSVSQSVSSKCRPASKKVP